MGVIRDTTQANWLLSALQYNAYVTVSPELFYATIISTELNNCVCATSTQCVSEFMIYDRLGTQVLSTVPNMYIGCYVIEGLRQSSLECFYNHTCFQQIITYFGLTPPSSITVMNASLSSRFLPTTTVGDLLDELMVEQWNWTTLYEDYFDECHPIECTYTYNTRNDLIYILTTTIGLVGGLTTALRLIIPRLVFFTAYLNTKLRRNTQNTVTPVATNQKVFPASSTTDPRISEIAL